MPNKSLLIAEDEPMLRRVLQRVLRKTPYEYIIVEDGQKAWERIQERSFDLIILDQNMPGYTGTELVVKIHKYDPTVKVVLASGDLPNMKGMVQPLGIIDKPFVLSTLLGQIERFLAQD